MSRTLRFVYTSRRWKPVFLVYVFLLSVSARSVFADSKAKSVLDTTDVAGGIVVVLGCDDQDLLIGLGPNERYLVHGLDTKSSVVQELRGDLQSKNLYGPVSVATYDGVHLPYADNLLNLLVDVQKVTMGSSRTMRSWATLNVSIARRLPWSV